MVITVTLNPSMDKTINVEKFSVGTVNRISKIRHDIGGKGINVSKVLKNFGIESVTTGFLGGMWKEYFLKELKAREIETSFTFIEGDTRTNSKVVDSVNKTYTDINEPGPVIKDEELRSFLSNFENMCNNGDIVVLSGGVSPNIPKSIYGTLIKIAKAKGAYTILDAEGELLIEALKEKPDVIKPNDNELAKLFDLKEATEEEIIKAARKLKEDGISKILVSLGEKGALYITERGIYFAKGLKVPVKSTVGAGDSMVAALVYSILNNLDDTDTLIFANACGAATVQLEGTEACTTNQVLQLLDKIQVEVR